MPNYTLEDINYIKTQGFNFSLPKTTQDLIMQLSKLVGSPDYIKTPIFQKKIRQKDNNEPDWEMLKQFKPTAKIERSYAENLIQELKGALHKITDKNYDVMRDVVFKTLENLKEMEEYELVLDIIFNVASSNRFYSQVYARMYKELMDKSSHLFKTRLEKEVESYIERFSEIKNVNPNEDYDAFCESNKENEQRKAMTEFFVNLMKLKVISIDEMTNINYQLCNLVLLLVDDSDQKHTIIELSENIFILLAKGGEAFNDAGVFSEMLQRIEVLTKMKTKDHPGLSNKSLFKFMDVMDIKI